MGFMAAGAVPVEPLEGLQLGHDDPFVEGADNPYHQEPSVESFVEGAAAIQSMAL